MMLPSEMSCLLCKTNRFHFALGLYSVIAQWMSKRGKNINHVTFPVACNVLFCTYHILTSSVRYQSKDAQQNGIYLLSATHARGFMFKLSFCGFGLWQKCLCINEFAAL